MAASTFAIDTALTPDYTNLSSFSATIQTTIKNEIVSKFNAMLETATGHTHDGTDSRTLTGGDFSNADVIKMLIGGGI